MTPDLNPCPFCGEEVSEPVKKGPTSNKWWEVVCEYCDCQGPMSETSDMAISAWNARAATKVKPLVWGEGQEKAVHAKSSVGLYVVYTCSGTMTGKFNPCLNAVGIGPGPRRVCDSLADAKAAAQADYERRIREALG